MRQSWLFCGIFLLSWFLMGGSCTEREVPLEPRPATTKNLSKSLSTDTTHGGSGPRKNVRPDMAPIGQCDAKGSYSETQIDHYEPGSYGSLITIVSNETGDQPRYLKNRLGFSGVVTWGDGSTALSVFGSAHVWKAVPSHLTYGQVLPGLMVSTMQG